MNQLEIPSHQYNLEDLNIFDEILLNSEVVANRTCTQSERKIHIREMCQKYSEFLSHGNFDVILNPRRNVAYCPIPKYGCSTWKTIMARSTRQELSRRIKAHKDYELKALGLKYVGRKMLTRLRRKPKTFVILRHPFTRFYSAYKDKLAPASSKNKTSSSKNETSSSKNKTSPSKNETSSSKNKTSSSKKKTSSSSEWRWRTNKLYILGRLGLQPEPPYRLAFNDFTSFVTKKMGRENLVENIHWITQQKHCDFCSEE